MEWHNIFTKGHLSVSRALIANVDCVPLSSWYFVLIYPEYSSGRKTERVFLAFSCFCVICQYPNAQCFGNSDHLEHFVLISCGSCWPSLVLMLSSFLQPWCNISSVCVLQKQHCLKLTTNIFLLECASRVGYCFQMSRKRANGHTNISDKTIGFWTCLQDVANASIPFHKP